MSQDALTHIIVTGQDPRGLPEFSALRGRDQQIVSPVAAGAELETGGIAGAGHF